MSSKLNEIMTMNLQNVSDAIIYLSTTLKITTHNLCEQIVTWVMNRSIMILIIGIVISGISLFIPPHVSIVGVFVDTPLSSTINIIGKPKLVAYLCIS
jgi:hypothetical protein